MSRIISFAWTSPALLAGAKSVTRRNWNHAYARRFTAGERLLAYDRSPRAHGQPIAVIRLTQAPINEPYGHMPDSDYEAEGFAWFEQHPDALQMLAQRGIDLPVPFARFQAWREEKWDCRVWVVRFELVEIIQAPGQWDRKEETCNA